MKLQFTKMTGAGNDFVMVSNLSGTATLSQEQIAHLCDRHFGIGADGLLAVEPSPDSAADCRMRYYNSDGGEAEMCGNGARCFSRYASRLLGLKKEGISFVTQVGIVKAQLVGEEVCIQLTDPATVTGPRSVPLSGGDLVACDCNTGVPHAVVFVQDIEGTPVAAAGREIRYHGLYAPKGTNVNFAHVSGPSSLIVRTYERGVEGETLACGTGVTACALVAAKIHGVVSPVSVKVRGGDTLTVSFEKTDSGYSQVSLRGPATFVFEGSIEV